MKQVADCSLHKNEKWIKNKVAKAALHKLGNNLVAVEAFNKVSLLFSGSQAWIFISGQAS